MKHLVTGGSGFLGSVLVSRLVSAGENVRVLDLWRDPGLPAAARFVEGDIRDPRCMANAMDGIDVVHHAAALIPLEKSGKKFLEVNVNGTRIVAEAAREHRVSRFVYFSSNTVYGIPERCPVTLDTPTRAIDPYGMSKLAGEREALRAFVGAEDRVVLVRTPPILGPGRLGIFQILFEWVRQGRDIYTIGSGKNTLQFIHVSDLVDFCLFALENRISGPYNVGSERHVPLRETLRNLIRHAGSRSAVKPLPARLAVNSLRLLDKLRLSPLAPWHYQSYHRDFYYDLEPVRQLGWKARLSNDEMLAENYDWYCGQAHRFSGSSAHRRPVHEGILSWVRGLS